MTVQQSYNLQTTEALRRLRSRALRQHQEAVRMWGRGNHIAKAHEKTVLDIDDVLGERERLFGRLAAEQLQLIP